MDKDWADFRDTSGDRVFLRWSSIDGLIFPKGRGDSATDRAAIVLYRRGSFFLSVEVADALHAQLLLRAD